MGCQTLWLSIQNIIHFTIFFVLLLKEFSSFLKKIHKIQPCPIPVLEKLTKTFFPCSCPVPLPNANTFYLEKYKWVQDLIQLYKRCIHIVLFHCLTLSNCRYTLIEGKFLLNILTVPLQHNRCKWTNASHLHVSTLATNYPMKLLPNLIQIARY